MTAKKCVVKRRLGRVTRSGIPVLAGEDVGVVKKGPKGPKGRKGHKTGAVSAAAVVARKLYGAAAASAARKLAGRGGALAGARRTAVEGAAAEVAAYRAARAGKAGRASAPAGPRAGTGASLAAAGYFEMRVAVAEPREGVYQTRHVDVQLSPEQGRGFHRLLAGAQGCVARLRNGKLVANVGDLVRWIAEQAC